MYFEQISAPIHIVLLCWVLAVECEDPVFTFIFPPSLQFHFHTGYRPIYESERRISNQYESERNIGRRENKINPWVNFSQIKFHIKNTGKHTNQEH